MAKFKRLVLDAGHGGTDPGAVGYGDNERDSMGPLADAIAKEARNRGIEVYQIENNLNTFQTNFYGTTSSLKTSDAIMELHRDGSSNTSASGGSVLITNKYPADELDKACGNVIKNYFGSNDYRGIIQRNDLYNMNTCASRGFNYRLLELGFISNKEENALLDEASEYKDFAKKLIDGIYHLFEGGEMSKSTKYYCKVVENLHDSRYHLKNSQYLMEFTNVAGVYRNKELTEKFDTSDFKVGQRVVSKYHSTTKRSGGKYWVHIIDENQYGHKVYFAYKREEI